MYNENKKSLASIIELDNIELDRLVFDHQQTVGKQREFFFKITEMFSVRLLIIIQFH